MVLAAGLGTRLRPLTQTKPKALVEVGGKTLLELTLLRLKQAGFKQVIINVHHHAQQIIDFVQRNDGFGLHVEFSLEDRLLDTGGGVKKARWFFKDVPSFLVHNVDVLTDLDYGLLFKHLANNLACLAIHQRQTHRYLIFNEHFKLVGWQNVKSGEKKLHAKPGETIRPWAFMGVQVLATEIFQYFPSVEVFSLIEAYLNIAAQNLPIRGLPFSQARWLDVGKKESLAQAAELFADQIK